MPPRVFISHASEDKGRFVVDFARRLREKGVDAWLDQWEMKPGDSIVDKIFEQGLKEAQAVIVVLSQVSVQKPWVREELNASVVSRISKGTKLIPVVIDDCNVPESLCSTVWQKVDDLNSYDLSMQRILAAIFDADDKPAIGNPPSRFSTVAKIAGLTRTDDLVLRQVASIQIEENNGLVMYDRLRAEPVLAEIHEQDLIDSLEILGQQSLINISRVIGAPLSHVALTNFGFQQYAEAYMDDYQETVTRISALLLNEAIYQNDELASRLDRPVAVVDFVLNLMEDSGYIKKSNYIGGMSRVWQISPSLRRALQ